MLPSMRIMTATTHVTALYSWLCMAADAAEETSAHLAAVDQVDFIEQELLGPQVSAALSFQHTIACTAIISPLLLVRGERFTDSKAVP